jgi:hypothetical protein
MSELSERIAFERELPRHLRELSVLLRRTVHRDELLSVQETKAVRARANEVARQPVARFEMKFEEKRTPRFADFVQRLARANPHDVYVWTPASNLCGLIRPIAVERVNIGFGFDLNPEGILAILTSDLRDQLLLDYSAGEGGEELLEVEVSGEHWGGLHPGDAGAH